MGLFNKSDASKSDFKKHYSLQDKLGAGNFAVVKKAKKTSKNPNVDVPEVVAVKLIDKSKCETMNDVQREIDIMQTAHHPNVIRLFEIYDEPATMHLVMELVTGGELLDRVVDKGSYSEQDAAQVMLSLRGSRVEEGPVARGSERAPSPRVPIWRTSLLA